MVKRAVNRRPKQVKKPTKKIKSRSKNPEEVKKRGSARLVATLMIDDLLNLEANKKRLKEAFQVAFDEDPVIFYKQFVHPVGIKELPIGTAVQERTGLKINFDDGGAEQIDGEGQE